MTQARNFQYSKLLSSLTLLLFPLWKASAQARFPEPEFESGYIHPELLFPPTRNLWLEYLDVAMLVVLLSLMSWFVLKKRSRKGIFWTSIASILYFGFFKIGCVCSVGSIQNVTMALFQHDYIIPVTVIAMFIIPLAFTLMFGRTFCAGVCFMGALQDLVNFRPISIPTWISKPLSAIPYIYLVLAVLLAATGADFIICRYDPFIGFFRMNASFGMVVFGIIILITGIFIGRPYCRFLCPYGVLLSWMSKLAFWHTTITPSACVQCHLCDKSCPVDAINKPITIKPEEPRKGRKRLLTLLLLLPLFVVAGGFVASLLYKPLASVHPTVKLAEEIKWEIDNNRRTGSRESKTFHAAGIPTAQLFDEAAALQKFYYKGSWIGGAFLGLMLGIGLINSSILKRRTEYEPDKGNCVSCGKCYKYCPVGKDDLTTQNEVFPSKPAVN